MSKLNVDQKNIKLLLADKKADFLIPDYQRPYAWGEDECQTLWDDIFEFAIPEGDATKFNSEEEYYLGPIVTFKNDNNKLEIIDGQQRLTTIMLLLRAFHISFGNMQDDNSKKIKEIIESCIWKTDEFGNADKNLLKIDSEVATDNDKEEFLAILNTGVADNRMKSKYAENYRYFQHKIEEFLHSYPSYFSYLPARILNNCILLPIEADNQNTALRIFSTLNDRGLPLSDADIFKAQLYNYYKSGNVPTKDKNYFIDKWRELEESCREINIPMDELFTRYMYFERAKQGIKQSTTEALRKFYEKDGYALLKNDIILHNLTSLVNFWKDIENQNESVFSDEVLRELLILNYAPNGMRIYFLSVYFMQYKNERDELDNQALLPFLKKIIGFIFAYAITNPGVNALRTPVYFEMINIVNNKTVTFDSFKFHIESLKTSLNNFEFLNLRPVTKSILTWWAFSNSNQKLIDKRDIFEIEHIFARNKNIQDTLVDKRNIDSIGNKVLLEKHINIRASDYKFEDKKKYYTGFTNAKGVFKEGTNIAELHELIKQDDFSEHDIEKRKSEILTSFVEYLKNNDLLKD